MHKNLLDSSEIMRKMGTYVLTQPGQNLHKSPNLGTLLTATLHVICGFS